jgi:hypothetical protein
MIWMNLLALGVIKLVLSKLVQPKNGTVAGE